MIQINQDKLYNTFKDDLVLRDRINNENFFNIVDEIFVSDDEKLDES